MSRKGILVIRLVLAAVFLFFIAGFVLVQYGVVRDLVRFICINCLGLSG